MVPGGFDDVKCVFLNHTIFSDWYLEHFICNCTSDMNAAGHNWQYVNMINLPYDVTGANALKRLPCYDCLIITWQPLIDELIFNKYLSFAYWFMCTWSETYFRQDLFPSYLFFRRQFHTIVTFRLKSISGLDSGSLPRFFGEFIYAKLKIVVS